nr:KOW motif-containing protein [Intestinimonas massiliensis (ex Afouda et al. 2020)]
MNKMSIRKDDLVVVLSGKDKGKQGKVLSVMPKEGKVVVEKVSVTYENLHKEVGPGCRILVDDGLIELRVKSVEGHAARQGLYEDPVSGSRSAVRGGVHEGGHFGGGEEGGQQGADLVHRHRNAGLRRGGKKVRVCKKCGAEI